MSNFANPEHESAVRMLGYALTRGTEAGWWDFSALLSMRLTRAELVALAYSLLMALDEQDAYDTAHSALFGYTRAE